MTNGNSTLKIVLAVIGLFLAATGAITAAVMTCGGNIKQIEYNQAKNVEQDDSIKTNSISSQKNKEDIIVLQVNQKVMFEKILDNQQIIIDGLPNK